METYYLALVGNVLEENLKKELNRLWKKGYSAKHIGTYAGGVEDIEIGIVFNAENLEQAKEKAFKIAEQEIGDPIFTLWEMTNPINEDD